MTSTARPDAPASTPEPPRTRRARAAVWATVLVTACHIAVVAIWIGPDNNLRRHLGNVTLSRYVEPLFDQNWSVFAPEADFGNDLFVLRGRVRAAHGVVQTTAWVSVTQDEIVNATRFHPFPSRTAAIGNRLATDLAKTFGALGTAQQQLVGTFDTGVSIGQERVPLLAAATSDTQRLAVTGYLRVETAAERYLSGIARGLWGAGLEAFQIERTRVLVTNYESRGNGPRETGVGVLFTSNWRPVQPLTEVELSAYAAYVASVGLR